MTYEQLGNLNISEFIYKKRNEIPIINVAQITPYNWGRIDIIIAQFCDNRIEYLPILLDFNKISNPFTIKMGIIINIPDFDFIIMNCEQKNVDDNKIPGIAESMNCKEVNRNLSSIIGSDSIITAPKLGALKKVTYDSVNGKIIF